jgi:hypothetical protein
MNIDTASKIVAVFDELDTLDDPSSHHAAELRGELARLCSEELRRIVVDKARKVAGLPALFE